MWSLIQLETTQKEVWKTLLYLFLPSGGKTFVDFQMRWQSFAQSICGEILLLVATYLGWSDERNRWWLSNMVLHRPLAYSCTNKGPKIGHECSPDVFKLVEKNNWKLE